MIYDLEANTSYKFSKELFKYMVDPGTPSERDTTKNFIDFVENSDIRIVVNRAYWMMKNIYDKGSSVY